jgi:hypothetical protein
VTSDKRGNEIIIGPSGEGLGCHSFDAYKIKAYFFEGKSDIFR